jgi:SAM-dependent methyltransferase
MPDYDVIGRAYTGHRRPDPRIARLIDSALGDVETVLNVGAGTGSYEPADRVVVALEPSRVMIAQRPAGAAPVIEGSADRLPFADGAFAAATAILTAHHWPDRRTGLVEMRRVARDRVVILTWDPSHPGFWLVRDYFPDLIEYDQRIFPALAELESALGGVEVSVVPIPYDCVDGFLGAYWRRPASYLDDGVRSCISTFDRISGVPSRIERLRGDLESGAWADKNSELFSLEQLDVGYRLVVGRHDFS